MLSGEYDELADEYGVGELTEEQFATSCLEARKRALRRLHPYPTLLKDRLLQVSDAKHELEAPKPRISQKHL